MTTFDALVREVGRTSSIEQMANQVAIILADAVKRRHNLTPDKELLTVSSITPNLDLLFNLNMVDISKTPIIDHSNPNSRLNGGPRLYFLNQKAIDYHSSLAQEGFYGFEH